MRPDFVIVTSNIRAVYGTDVKMKYYRAAPLLQVTMRKSRDEIT